MNTQELKWLYDLGLALHWLHPRSKRPKGFHWQQGPRLSWEELKASYIKGNNVGVRTGEPSRLKGDAGFLAIIDIDVKSDTEADAKEAYSLVCAFLGVKALDKLPQVKSGRGGASLHIYARTSKPVSSFNIARSNRVVKVKMPSVPPTEKETAQLSSDELAQGFRLRSAYEVDFLGTGKQAAIPASIHPDTGKPYVWHIPIADVNDLPLVGAEKLKASKKVETKAFGGFVAVDLGARKLPQKYKVLIESMEGLDEYNGDRSAALFAAISVMVGVGFKRDEVVSVLIDPGNAISEVAFDRVKSEADAARWIGSQVDKVMGGSSPDAVFADTESVAAADDWGDFDDPVRAAAESKAVYDELGGWEIELDKSQNGSIKLNLKNTVLYLKHFAKSDEWLVYNLHMEAQQFVADPPWANGRKLIGKEVYAPDQVDCKHWLSTAAKFEAPTKTIEEAFGILSRRKQIHPVREYLATLCWDGVPRLTDWLYTYFGVSRSAYTTSVARKVLIAAIARVMDPGTKFDHVLILEGDQGLGKSTAVSILAGKWYGDTLGDVENKDVINQLHGKWIIELGELSSMHKSDRNALKAFITKMSDRARVAYDRSARDYPRQCIFIGTTNDDQFLSDETGNRRYWPVKITKVEIEKLKRDRDQLWAEALFEFELGEEKLWLDDKNAQKQALEIQAEKMIEDPWEEHVETWLLEQKKEARKRGKNDLLLTLDSVALDALGKNSRDWRSPEMRRLAAILKKKGFNSCSDGQKRRWKILF